MSFWDYDILSLGTDSFLLLSDILRIEDQPFGGSDVILLWSDVLYFWIRYFLGICCFILASDVLLFGYLVW